MTNCSVNESDSKSISGKILLCGATSTKMVQLAEHINEKESIYKKKFLLDTELNETESTCCAKEVTINKNKVLVRVTSNLVILGNIKL